MTDNYKHFGAYNRQQKNPNPLLDNKFTFAVTKLPEVSWSCRSANLPGISVPVIEQNTPFNNIPHCGSKVDYEHLEVTFIVDADLNNYREITNWIRAMAEPVSRTPYGKLKNDPLLLPPNGGLTSDAQLVVLSNNSVPNFVIYYRDAFPISLSGITFTNDTNSPIEQTATVTFVYEYYDLEPIKPESFDTIFTYYIDPDTGDDTNNGTSKTTAWKTVGRSNTVTLQAGQTIGYKYNGTWELYRELGMTVNLFGNITSDIVDTPTDTF